MVFIARHVAVVVTIMLASSLTFVCSKSLTDSHGQTTTLDVVGSRNIDANIDDITHNKTAVDKLRPSSESSDADDPKIQITRNLLSRRSLSRNRRGYCIKEPTSKCTGGSCSCESGYTRDSHSCGSSCTCYTCKYSGSSTSKCCNGKSVKTSYIRDGDNDCGDGSDETNPPFQCTTTRTTSTVTTIRTSTQPSTTNAELCGGRTLRGGTSWVKYETSGIYVDVDTSACGFKSSDRPIYINSFGGRGSHYDDEGGNQVYGERDKMQSTFRTYFDGTNSVSIANSEDYHVNYIAAPGTASGSVCSGRTSDWFKDGSGWIATYIYTTYCDLGSNPIVMTSMGGTSSHWNLIGTNSLYFISDGKYKLHVKSGSVRTSADWHMNFIAVPTISPHNSDGICSGNTGGGTTFWQKYSSSIPFVDVDTSKCGFKTTPVYVTSVHCVSSCKDTNGASEIYSPTATGFRIYLKPTSGNAYTNAKSTAKKWHIHWIAKSQDVSFSVSTNTKGQYVAEADCKAYAASIGKSFSKTTCAGGTCAPQGCYVLTSDSTIWWNADKTGTCTTDRKCVYLENGDNGGCKTVRSGIKTCNSDSCSVSHTFTGLPNDIESAHISVRQAGDLDGSSEYVSLKVGGSTLQTCKTDSSDYWREASNCQNVDVTSKVTSSGALAVVVDGTSDVGADDDDANGPTNTPLAAEMTLVWCEKAGCSQGQYQTSQKACVACGANTYQSINNYDGSTCSAQPYCGRGQKASAGTKLAKRTCTACPTGQYQDSSSHRDDTCKTQPSCGRGELISSASTTSKQTCSACSAGEYQDASSHQETSCEAQPFCTTNQKISAYSATAKQTCSACPAKQKQMQSSHQEMECISECGANQYGSTRGDCTAQPFCGIGEKISPDSSVSKRTCSSCPSGSYQDSSRHRSMSCTPQPSCTEGQHIPFQKASKTKKQTCEACPANTYQPQAEFTGGACLAQATCMAGMYASPTSKVELQTCIECPTGTYQTATSHRNEMCTKQPERGCTKGQYLTEVSPTTKGVCKADLPCGEDQTYTRILGKQGDCSKCPTGTAQPKGSHFESLCSTTVRCNAPKRDPATMSFTSAFTCNGRGTPSDSGECDCMLGSTGCQCQCTTGTKTDGTCFACAAGYAGPNHGCQFSDKDTCSGRGVAKNDGTCKNCDETGSAGTYCEFTDDEYCCGFASVDNNGNCGLCGSGTAGEHCQFSSAVSCFGNGLVQDDGSCICNNGFDVQTDCAECEGNIASGTNSSDPCNTCVPEKLASSFPECDIPTCTRHGTFTPSSNDCECGVGWRGSRCECFDNDSGEDCLGCAADDDGIAYALTAGECVKSRRQRLDAHLAEYSDNDSYGTGEPKARDSLVDWSVFDVDSDTWSCATTTSTTTFTREPTTAPVTTATTTENPRIVRLREAEAEAEARYTEKLAELTPIETLYNQLKSEWEKKCSDGTGARSRREDLGNVTGNGGVATGFSCISFDATPCYTGNCKPCSFGKPNDKSGNPCTTACSECVQYATDCNDDDDDNDGNDVDESVDLSDIDKKAEECKTLRAEFEEAEKEYERAKAFAEKAESQFASASSAYNYAIDTAASTEEKCLLLSKGGIDNQTIVLIIALILLLFAQTGARVARQDGEHTVSLTVEVIVFFSILDQITDATYVITEVFQRKTLEGLGVTFCILPVVFMMMYFYFKCYRITTRQNLAWRYSQVIKPFTECPHPYLMYTVVYPVVAAFATAVLAMVYFLPLPIEAALLPLEMGFRVGMKSVQDMMDWANKKAKAWAAKTSLGLIPALILYLGVILYGLLKMTWFLLLALFLPLIWSIMMVVRTFAILPGVWVWIENQLDYMLRLAKEPNPTGMFSYKYPRECAECGEDLGVFRLFHPNSPDDTPARMVPVIDYEAQYLMLSGTLVFEFIFESLPQIIIQIVNNFDNENWAKDPDIGCTMLDEAGMNRIGWRAFTIISVVLSAFVAFDSLYRQLYQTFVMKEPFGSPKSFGVKENLNQLNFDMRQDDGKMATLRKDRRTSMKLDKERQKAAARVAAKAAAAGTAPSFAKSRRVSKGNKTAKGAKTKKGSKKKTTTQKPSRGFSNDLYGGSGRATVNPMFAGFEAPMYADVNDDGYVDVNDNC